MRRATAWAMAVLAAGASAAASAQTSSSRSYWVVRSGAVITVYKVASVNPDCSPLGRASVNLVTEPLGGQVSVGYIRDDVAYAPNNPRAACNRPRIPTTAIVYRSRPDFTGTDRFSAEVVTPEGGGRTLTFEVQVR